MLIDCDSCSARGRHCHDCVITVLLGSPAPRVELDSQEQIAFVSLAEAGLVPPLRLVPSDGPHHDPQHDTRGIA